VLIEAADVFAGHGRGLHLVDALTDGRRGLVPLAVAAGPEGGLVPAGDLRDSPAP
jgi:hypothetical protein